MSEFTEVSEEEFQAFLASYPDPLVKDVFAAYEPPLVTYNDFLLAPLWPESVVAKKMLGEPGGYVRVMGRPPSLQQP